MKKILKSLFIVGVLTVLVTGATRAVWTADTKVLNDNSFITGNADLQVWDANYTAGVWEEWIDAPTFEDIYPEWEQNYSLAVRNNGTVNLKLSLTKEWKGGWALWKDPQGLRNHIWVEVWKFNDDNSNRHWDSGEDFGGSLGKKSLGALSDGNPINLGEMDADSHQWYLFRFTTDGLVGLENATLQRYTFVFDGTTDGATQLPTSPLP